MYSGVKDEQRWVMPLVLEEHARTRPHQRCVSVIDGGSLTYVQLHEQAAKVASLLQQRGLGAGDRIALMLPNDLDMIRAWAGVGYLGAIAVMINPELTNDFLAHPLRDSQPRGLVIHDSFLPRLAEIASQLPAIETVFVVAGETPLSNHERFEAWEDCVAVSRPTPAAHDAACIMYTSGTTGAPKGVVMPHAHCFLFGLGVVQNLGVTTDDHYYIVLPLFHANGLLMQLCGALIAGAQATIRQRFSASAWLPDVKRSGATITHTLGAVSAFVIAQPATEGDRDHKLRLIMAAPNMPEHEQIWRERFGIPDVLGGYGMTEVNIPLYGERSKSRPGACGRVFAPYFEVEIRDPETDFPVGPEEVGEIMVRPRVANGFMASYFNLPGKTVEAWRNLWFHTGDAGRMGPDGYVMFVDRIKDCIRRRGENISATDIEAAIGALPGILEIAAYAAPSEVDGGEDEIMLAIVLEAQDAVSATAIANHARRTMPRFAWPRYVVFRSSLPKTGTEKVRKVELRKAGVTPDAVDLAPHYAK